MATGYTYENKNTGDVYTFAEPAPDLDALSNWTRKEVEVPQSALDAVERSRAQQKSIETAAADRYDKTAAAAAGTVSQAGARASSLESGVPVPTLANLEVLGEVDQTPLLSSGKDRGGHVQINQTVHPIGHEALLEKQRKDIENPPTTGVLGRAKRDHRTGATQIGDNPEVHRKAEENADVATSSGAEANRADVVPEPVTKADAGAGPAADVADGAPASSDPPKGNAKKADWVNYAVASGGLDRAQAEALTADELRERFSK